MAAFVTVLLCSNLIGASKVCRVGDFTFSAGVLFFPISYIFGGIPGFAAIFFGAFMSWVVLAMPASAEWGHQEALQTVFGATPRIVVGSLVAYWAGEFCNSYLMARLKLWTEGRLLFVRTIGSTVLGQAVDYLLPGRLLRHLAERRPAGCPVGQLRAQGGLGSDQHAGHLRRRELFEARRTGGLLRPPHRLHALLSLDVRVARVPLRGGPR